MAKVLIEVDTSAKTMQVKVDDKKVSNVKEVYVVKDEEYFNIGITSIDDAADDLKKVTRLFANEKGEFELSTSEIQISEIHWEKPSFFVDRTDNGSSISLKIANNDYIKCLNDDAKKELQKIFVR